MPIDIILPIAGKKSLNLQIIIDTQKEYIVKLNNKYMSSLLYMSD